MLLDPIDCQHTDAPQQFVDSLHEIGFAVLANHPIQPSVLKSIYMHWHAFFQDPTKHQYQYNKATQDGFFSTAATETAKGYTEKDIKEYFHYYPWGQCPVSLKSEIEAYYQFANEFACQLLDWVEQGSPPSVTKNYSQPLSSMVIDCPQTLLRILHYPPLQGNEPLKAIRAAAHEDINLLTLLPASNEPGLQVKAKNGEWLEVPCDFGLLIVNTGDMLQEASGGYFPSTSHRVINPQGEKATHSRISLPLFLHARPEVILSARYTAHSYLQERLVELGVIS